MEKEYQKFHGLVPAYIVKVCEGNGTEESPLREVQYVFDESLTEIGKIDSWLNNERENTSPSV
jgi:hypothetical protein